MKITFLQSMPDNFDKPFGIYQYDEQLAQNSNYIDIRGVVKENAEDWLDQIQCSHSQLSKKFLRYTRWWWITGMSRLDARPWGQEHLLKPLFFARAVLEWSARHQDTEEIFLIGCPHEVAIYLREFKKSLVIENSEDKLSPVFFVFFLCKHLLIAFLKLSRSAVHIARHHLFHKRSFVKSDILVLYEAVANTSLTSGYKYYYDGLFDTPGIAKNISVAYGCIDSVFLPVKELRPESGGEIFFLIDNISFSGFIKSILINIYLILLTSWVSISNNSCKFGNYNSSWFWANYLLSELSRTFFLDQTCCYFALGNIFKLHRYKRVISTYEEKTIERAVLFSCKEAGIPVIGYIPHPQHHLTLALRNAYRPWSPKPENYAVCGQKYVDYFLSWCKKEQGSITVWGSKKARKEKLTACVPSRHRLNILLLISHPNELRIFCSWLRAEPRISQNITYLLRIYKAVNSKIFSKELRLIKDFNCFKEACGSFQEDLDSCDLAVFCGTSAGPIAINNGRLAIHIALDDFFHINPCFNDLSAMLSCSSAAKFADILEEICSMDVNSFSQLYRKQCNFVSQIFSPIQEQSIEREILSKIA